VATGSGTVVTGTLTGGVIAVHDVLEVVGPSEPSVHGRGARVRGLQTHGQAAQEVGPGHRLALNLSGPSHDQLTRGQALVRSGQWQPTRTCDASLSVLAGTGHEVSQRGAYRAYFGSGQYTVRLRLLQSSPLLPARTGRVRIHLPSRLPLLPGDRYVLREVGRSETVGGGEVLDVAPILPAARARPDRSVDRVVQERSWIEADLLERLTGQRRPPTVGCWVVDPEVLTETRRRLTRAVEEAGSLGLPLAGLSEQERAVLAETEGLDVHEGRACRSGSESDSLAEHPFIDRLNSSPFAPPDPRTSGVGRVELRELVRRGYIVDCDGCYFSADAMEQAVAVTARLLSEHPDGVTTSEVRQALGTTRKFVLPLLAYFDHTGVTRRRGDRRVAGPRLPTSSGS
jgi:selenocysteine-specific elongation factor